MHTGPVLVVRWAGSGKWLASGSDDTIVMIWDLDPYVISFSLGINCALTRPFCRNGGGKVWGSEDVNVEGWKALRRLTGHESGPFRLVLPGYWTLTFHLDRRR
jgi:protein HIRA/HIR1